jgi:ABC-2 type transport system ATP-binding protein
VRRALVLLLAAAVVAGAVAGLAAALGDPPVEVEVIAVRVPERRGASATLDLDAALHLPAEVPAPAVLLAHGFGSDRTAMTAAAERYARRGYVALTWSARGFGASDGVVGLDDPDREVADVSALVDLLAGRPEVEVVDGDPVVGVAGGSYGGGLALLAAAQEPRLDAVVAAGAWHSLPASLSPPTGAGGVLKDQWLAGLFTSALAAGLRGEGRADEGKGAPAAPGPAGLDLAEADLDAVDLPALVPGPGVEGTPLTCGRVDVELCRAHARVAAAGRLDAAAAELLDRASPGAPAAPGGPVRAAAITAPLLLRAGIDDTLFPLDQSLATARAVAGPVAVRWVAGGHGLASRVDGADAVAWFDLHLRGVGPSPAAFAWEDAVGDVVREEPALPADAGGRADGAVLELVLAGGGRAAEPGGADAIAPGAVPLLFPPGGLPASVSTIPGLSDLAGDDAGGFDLAGLVPAVDLPGQSASWTAGAAATDLPLVGTPRLRAVVRAGGPTTLFVRLADVTPGGRATLLGGVTALRVPAGRSDLDVRLLPVARRLVAGDRLRITVATTDLGYATGDQSVAVLLSDGHLSLPTTAVAPPSTVPVLLRVLLPVLLVAAAAAAGLLLTRRHERRLAAAREDACAGCAGIPGTTRACDHPPDAVVEVRGLVKRYPDGKVAVDGLDLLVRRGQVVGLLGPNGAGKTTTIRMLLGLIRPTEGEIAVLGHRMRPGHPVLARVGVLVEGPGFAPYLTGRQNLRSWWRAGGRPDEEADWDRALGVADLGAALDKPVRTYSHGMRQRLAIAQALLGRPELLVLDEPTDGLDPEQIRGMRQLLARLGAEGLTVLVSSHLLAEVEQMCTHAVVVRSGRVVAAGPVAELRGGTRTVVVEVDDRAAARLALAGVVEGGGLDVEGAGLVVDLGGAEVADVVAALVRAGVRVSAVTPRGRLEDAFLALTSDDPQPVGGGAA